jgi:predicted metal-dependent hydrolase
MLFDRIFKSAPPPPASVIHLPAGRQPLPLLLVRHPRARRYLLRLRPDGVARVTIPRGGSAAAAREFAGRHAAWLEREWQRLKSQPPKPATWKSGAEIFLCGDAVRIEPGLNGESGTVRFGGESLRVMDPAADLRPAIEGHLRRLAARELPPRVLELAARHGLTVRRVTVRNQKSRWGSCSRRGTISLNWRLIQTPAFVSDYVCLHELMHLRQMNHSPRFWHELERVCPDYRTAKRWLKEHSGLLR